MKKFGKVLIVDSSKESLIRMRHVLNGYFNIIDCESNPNLIPSCLNRGLYDLYILEMNYKSGRNNGNEGLFWMNRIFEYDASARVILITSNAGIETAVRAIKGGAADFLQKPMKAERILAAIFSAGKLNKSDTLSGGLKPVDRRKPREVKIIGVSHVMKKLLSQLSKVAGTEANVLITGENGTGKEVVARALHKLSGRAGEVFVKVDIGSVSSSLFESELFGHKQGAFTDAHHDRAGRIESAEKGTLFLDEIANIPLELQSKILSVLQNRQVYRIGTNTGIPVNIRLITATNMPLDKLVREGKFREDLLYRLNTITINIPPLRERKADIPVLFNQFKENFEHKYAKVGLTVGTGVLELLEAWHWPGNVRELEHAVEKAVIMSENGVITVDEFSFRKNGDIILPGEPECFNLAKNEMHIIHQAIKSCKGNLSQASRVLGITRKTLYNKINKYGI